MNTSRKIVQSSVAVCAQASPVPASTGAMEMLSVSGRQARIQYLALPGNQLSSTAVRSVIEYEH
jgi:hypothetical protein